LNAKPLNIPFSLFIYVAGASLSHGNSRLKSIRFFAKLIRVRLMIDVAMIYKKDVYCILRVGI